MPRRKRQYCVALGAMIDPREAHEFMLGVLDFREHADHWEFFGTGNWPFIAADQLDKQPIDGLIGLFHELSFARKAIASGVPAVNVSTSFEDLPMPQVGNDDAAIGQMGAAYLLGLGFAEFGFVHWSKPWFSARRLAAFREALRDAGRDCHVLELHEFGGRRNVERLGEWLKTLPKPAGIMAVTDSYGAATIAAAREQGLRVPEDIAVLGVDNQRWTTAIARPPLTSIEPDSRRIGYLAAKLLDDLMRGRPINSPRWVRPLGVVERRSTDVRLQADALVAEALTHIRDHFTEGLSVEHLLDALGVSRRSLELRMKKAIGQTPQNAIYQAQIEHAKRLLAGTEQSMGEITRACGIPRQAQFNILFRRLTGMTPGQYRRQAVRAAP